MSEALMDVSQGKFAWQAHTRGYSNTQFIDRPQTKIFDPGTVTNLKAGSILVCMAETPSINWPLILTIFGILIVVGLLLSVVLMIWIFLRIKRIQLPPDAGFIDTLRATPLSVIILVDLLDMTLDFFSMPISWIVLGRLGLQQLRTATLVEAAIPGTQFLPTMTAIWLVAHFTDPDRETRLAVQNATPIEIASAPKELPAGEVEQTVHNGNESHRP